MLVCRIIGKCPGCGEDEAFGNVSVGNNTLLRGCKYCTYKENVPLPDIKKGIIYLDQLFLSHAFRANLPKFVECAKLIDELSHEQLIICPWSYTHEIETYQWQNPQKDKLFEFIKRTSRGHHYKRSETIIINQICKSFDQFVKKGEVNYNVQIADALQSNIHSWNDYIWIDVKLLPDDPQKVAQAKRDVAKFMIQRFDDWRHSDMSFDEHWKCENKQIADNYFNAFINMRLMA
jgi:hypothetical protein